MSDLSVLIAARNEEFLARTVQDVLANARGDTDVVVVLDGAWANPPLPQHQRVSVIYQPEPRGQRASVNTAARIASGEYVMKLDAHCAVSPGFDVELVRTGRALGPDVTQIPRMFNLHAFDWVCPCGYRRYQGPALEACPACGGHEVTRELVWQPKRRPVTDFARFDRDLVFGYWQRGAGVPGYAQRPEAEGDVVDVMSSIGACFVLSRRRFLELGGLDERHGSWGQLGTEIACKSWLSGGRQVVNKRAWFAHLFRTQPGFRFPYPLSQRDVDAARAHSRRLWIEGQWPQARRPLRWLVDKFWPVPGWTEQDREALPAAAIGPSAPAPRPPSKGIVYYTDGHCPPAILEAVQRQLRRAAPTLPIAAVALEGVPADLAFADVALSLPLERGYLAMFRQMLAGLEALDTDLVYFCEHDVLYAPEHFAFTPPARDRYFYNLAVWKVDAVTGRAVHYHTKQTSGLCADRQLLVEHYRRRLALVEAQGFSRRMGFEPGSHRRPERVDDVPSEAWFADTPNVDIRHGQNLTPSRWSPDEFRSQRNCRGWTESAEVPGWGRTLGCFDAWLQAIGRRAAA